MFPKQHTLCFCFPHAERYCAKLAGLYPEDPLQAAIADQAAFQVMDFVDVSAVQQRVKARMPYTAHCASVSPRCLG